MSVWASSLIASGVISAVALYLLLRAERKRGSADHRVSDAESVSRGLARFVAATRRRVPLGRALVDRWMRRLPDDEQ